MDIKEKLNMLESRGAEHYTLYHHHITYQNDIFRQEVEDICIIKT